MWSRFASAKRRSTSASVHDEVTFMGADVTARRPWTLVEGRDLDSRRQTLRRSTMDDPDDRRS